MDRPSRKTKTVNYCEAKDFDDDEDFACVKPPPGKKARNDGQQDKRPSSKSSSQESDLKSTASQKSGRRLDERLHERDLEAAITLSLLNNSDIIEDQAPTSKGDVQVLTDENTSPASVHRSNCIVDTVILGLDEITSEKETLSPSRQRKAVSKATVEQSKKDEDEDYEPKLTPDSESDEDFSEPAESEDEEFTVKKVSKTKKKEKATEKSKKPPAPKKEKPASKPSKSKPQAAASMAVRSPPTAKVAPKRPASSPTVSTSKAPFSLSPAGGRIPKWTPPGQVGSSPSSSRSPAVKSPAQGLRLGLSRLVRVKPLHPSVASH